MRNDVATTLLLIILLGLLGLVSGQVGLFLRSRRDLWLASHVTVIARPPTTRARVESLADGGVGLEPGVAFIAVRRMTTVRVEDDR